MSADDHTARHNDALLYDHH